MPPTPNYSLAFIAILPSLALAHSFSLNITPSILIFLVAFTVTHFLYNVVLYPLFFTPFAHLPCPPGRSLINGHVATLSQRASGEPPEAWVRPRKVTSANGGIDHGEAGYGGSDLLRYYEVLNLERILVASPAACKEVLVTRAHEFVKGPMFRWTVGNVLGFNGLLLTEGAVHRQHRRILNAAFGPNQIKALYPVFWSKAAVMISGIQDQLSASTATDPTRSPTIQISDWASRATLDVIGTAALGRENGFGALVNPENELNESYRNIFTERSLFLSYIRTVVGSDIFDWFPLGINRHVHEAITHVRRIAKNCTSEKRQQQQIRKKTIRTNELPIERDILSTALKSNIFSDEVLVDHLMTFFAAGHETSAISLQWAIRAICLDPEIQHTLRAEVHANLANPTITTDANPKIDPASVPYLHAVCWEALRMFPPIPITFRAAMCDTQLCGTYVPAGTSIAIAFRLLNRDPALWGPYAGVFNPKRWLSVEVDDSKKESIGGSRGKTVVPLSLNTPITPSLLPHLRLNPSGGAISNYAFSTFLHGPHSCIGATFSRIEIAALMAALVGQFELELEGQTVGGKGSKTGCEDDVDGPMRASMATTGPVDGVRVRMKPVAW